MPAKFRVKVLVSTVGAASAVVVVGSLAKSSWTSGSSWVISGGASTGSVVTLAAVSSGSASAATMKG